jgi:starch-binding outer membrane protein, SusD/RagB family
MTRTTLRRAAIGVALMAFVGCDSLDVSDPTAIEESDVTNGTGADLLRKDVLFRFSAVLPDQIHWGGMLADEIRAYSTDNSFDRRDVLTELRLAKVNNGFYPIAGFVDNGGPYGRWQEVRSAATLALAAGAGGRLSSVRRGELFALRGYAALNLAEGFCSGFPLHEIVNNTGVVGSPLTTTEVFERALADLDSAVALSADSARVLNFARVGRARVLVGLGRLADAATTVAAIPTTYSWKATYSAPFSGLSNGLSLWTGAYFRSVANLEGGNGLDFIDAKDPRVPTLLVFTSTVTGQKRYSAVTYSTKLDAPIVVASGIEARLIEAEAALKAGGSNWLTILNTLRQGAITPALAPLADPGTATARVDLLFRERAFWLYLTGHRLGDLRRLLSQYGRSATTTFPSGPYPLGGTYGTATSLIFPVEIEKAFNPEITGCTGN